MKFNIKEWQDKHIKELNELTSDRMGVKEELGKAPKFSKSQKDFMIKALMAGYVQSEDVKKRVASFVNKSDDDLWSTILPHLWKLVHKNNGGISYK